MDEIAVDEEKRNDDELCRPLMDELVEETAYADDSDDDDDDVVVKIGDIKANVPFHSGAKSVQSVGIGAGKLDIDSTTMINGQPIYDMDLAMLDDKPWRKPGADVTDYFNYGFTEESWNMYCERQKKLRVEYGNQAAVNKALFSSITLNNPTAPIQQLGRPQALTVLGSGTTVQINGQQTSESSKIVVNLAEKVKQLTSSQNQASAAAELVAKSGPPSFRTVIQPGQPPILTSLSSNSLSTNIPSPATQNSSIPILGGSISSGIVVPSASANSAQVVSVSGPISVDQPPPSEIPDLTQPPPMMPSSTAEPPESNEGPPGVDSPRNLDASPSPEPVLVDSDTHLLRQIPAIGPINTSVPPPQFNPNLPPPGMTPGPIPTIRLGMHPTNLPPPGFAVGLLPPGVAIPPTGYRFPPANVRPPPQVGRAGFTQLNPYLQERERSPASYSDKSSDLDDSDYRYRSTGRRFGANASSRRRSRSRTPPFSPRNTTSNRSIRRPDDRDSHKSRPGKRRSRSNSPKESGRLMSRRKDDEKKKSKIKEEDEKERKKRRRKSDDESGKKDNETTCKKKRGSSRKDE